jgi:hypothetical protein
MDNDKTTKPATNSVQSTAEWQDVGGFVTDGCLGEHTVRLLFSPDYDERMLAITVDGEHRRPRTLRGVEKCITKMVVKGHRKNRS